MISPSYESTQFDISGQFIKFHDIEQKIIVNFNDGWKLDRQVQYNHIEFKRTMVKLLSTPYMSECHQNCE